MSKRHRAKIYRRLIFSSFRLTLLQSTFTKKILFNDSEILDFTSNCCKKFPRCKFRTEENQIPKSMLYRIVYSAIFRNFVVRFKIIQMNKNKRPVGENIFFLFDEDVFSKIEKIELNKS